MKVIANILCFVFASVFIVSNSLLIAYADEKLIENNIITLSAESQRAGGIEVIKLEPQVLTKYIQAPGEIIPNSDSTAKVTSRVSAKVIKRYVQEGQHVKTGDKLVVLSSVDVSKTQGDLLLAYQEWERVKSLGKDAISAKRYSEAQINYQSAFQTALASGMSEAEIKELLQTQKLSHRKGEFELTAPRDGTAFNINVTQGELVDPGRVLLQIVDEATVWVDAKLSPELAHHIKIGDAARIEVEGSTILGKVIQVYHQIDETTRTRTIRIELPNKNDRLHPGQFVNCQIESEHTLPVLAVPLEAVIQTADGDSAIYQEIKPGQFKQVEIKPVETINNQVIISGVVAGARVVTKGAFFIHAELNKKGFEGHSH